MFPTTRSTHGRSSPAVPAALCGDPASRATPSAVLSLIVLLVVVALLSGCGGGTPDAGQTEVATTDEPAADGQPCVAPAAWFPQSQTPEPDPNQPFDSFCAFHQWAWQSFLWLTQPDGDTTRFETFPTVADVIAGERAPASAGPMRLAVRAEKVDRPAEPLSEISQANSMGVLVDHGGRVTYYAQYVNPTMFEEIVSKRWNDPTVLNEIPPDTEFQVGDVELKASWKILAEGEDGSGFLVRKALVDRLVQTAGGGIAVDTDAPPIEVSVALVGLHVVGWVEGHPEAVWATFEQDDNAPDLAPSQSPSAPVSDRDWTFYTADTLALDCNQLNSTLLVLDPATQTVTPVTQVCRQFPHGMVAGSTDPDDQQNLAAITSLNQSVKSQLAADNLWRNYFEVGAIWTDGNLQPNDDLQANRLGSTLLNSSTIETFTQNVASENNCFSCHNTLMYNPTDPSIQPLQGTNLNVSHIIMEAYVANQPTSDSDQSGR